MRDCFSESFGKKERPESKSQLPVNSNNRLGGSKHGRGTKHKGLAEGFENKTSLQQKVMDSLSFSLPWHPQYLRTRKRQPSCNSLSTFWGIFLLTLRQNSRRSWHYTRNTSDLEGLFRAVQCHLPERAEQEEFGISWLFSHYNFVFTGI